MAVFVDTPLNMAYDSTYLNTIASRRYIDTQCKSEREGKVVFSIYFAYVI